MKLSKKSMISAVLIVCIVAGGVVTFWYLNQKAKELGSAEAKDTFYGEH